MQVQLVASMAALDLERTRLSSTQLRANVGLATQLELAAARTRVVEVELALRAQQQKISIRREFTAGQIDGPMAELRVLEVEATQRLETIRPKLDMAGKLLKDLQTNVEIGTSAPFDLQEAKLRMAQLELDLRKAELDFMIVRKQIDQRKGK
jgi:outer membrane protein TolC